MIFRVVCYSLEIVDYQEILIYEPAQILSVAVSRSDPDNEIDLWALCRDGGAEVRKGIYVAGTGHPLPAEMWSAKFIGTVVTPGQLVRHVWTGPVRHD